MLNRHFRAISLVIAQYFPVRLYRTRLMASHSSGVRIHAARETIMSSGSSHPSKPPLGSQTGSQTSDALGASGRENARPSNATTDIDIARFYQEALAGALKLLGADGGELAMLDPVRRGMVVRARIRIGSRGASGSGSAFGAPARSSQPLPYSSARYDPSRAPVSQPLPAQSEIGEQPTVLLAAMPTVRVYRQDEGLIGAVWQRADVIVLRGEEYRALAHGTNMPGVEALWHVGAPIYSPGALDTIPPIGGPGEIIGVLTVYSDAMRGFSIRDIEALRLHADRVSRDLRMSELARQSQSQGELLEVLRSGAQDLPALYQRIRDLVRHLVDAPSFALVLYYPQGDEVALEVAERDGSPIPATHRRAATLPAWWNAVRAGQVVRNASSEERAAHPEFSTLGWGGDLPIASLLAAPLTTGSSFLGALVAASPRPEAYGPEQAQLFEVMARAGAIVLENGRLANEMRHSAARNQQKAHQMAVLNNAALTINASLDLKTTVQALADQASHLAAAEFCSVYLLDDTRAHLVASASSRRRDTQSEQQPSTPVPLTWRDVGHILRSGQFTVMDHLEQDWQDNDGIGRLLKEYQIYSGLLLPISHRSATSGNQDAPAVREDDAPQEPDELLGALFAYTPGQRHHFSPTEIGLLQGLASQAGAAISNARLYQNLKEAKERLEEVDKLKNDFILTISHEFRTPLTTINGYISLITRHGQKLEPEKLSQFGSEIQLATDKLAGMIGMLADASMLEERELDVRIEPVNLRAMAQRAIAGLTEDLKGRISLDIPEDMWTLADAERLPMVLSNLLTNAGKYAPGSPYRLAVRRDQREPLQQRGKLHSRTEADGKGARNNETVVRTARAHDQWLVIHVIDSGPGIAIEDLDRIFDRFVRTPQSLTTPVRGTGLGLWICREYVEAMGGNIWVESALGRGSDFQFCLPETAPPPP
jgi:signal transduction histidine kinase